MPQKTDERVTRVTRDQRRILMGAVILLSLFPIAAALYVIFGD